MPVVKVISEIVSGDLGRREGIEDAILGGIGALNKMIDWW